MRHSFETEVLIYMATIRKRPNGTYEIKVSCGYGVDGKQLSTQYKEHFSDYRRWEQLSHAGDWLLFDKNLGESLSINETCLSSGEVYTFLTNKAGKGGRGTLVAVVRGTKAGDVIKD